MKLFGKLFRGRDAPSNSTAGSGYGFFMGSTASGKRVNARSAMQMTAVYSCVRILSEAVAGLPLQFYRYNDNGGKEKAVDHPLYFLLHDEPNPEMTSFVFRETLMTHLLLWGNAYSQIIRNGKGEIVALYPLMPDRMTVDRDEHGRLYYEYLVYDGDDVDGRTGTDPKANGKIVRLHPADVLHIPGLGFDGLVGYSPIAMAKNAIGLAIAAEEYDRRLVDVLNEENIMRRLATRIVTSGEHKINIAATKPAASWIEEGGALTFGDATFDQKILDAHKLHVAIKVTEELLYDNAFNLENYIIVQFGKALANAEEDAFLNGNGTGKPTGIFDGTGGGHLLNTLAAALKSDDMLDLVYGLKRPYRKNASFIMNDATLPSLRKLKDNNGAYIWQPAYQAGELDRILGYKVETSAYAPKDGIAFGDYSYYNIGDRGNRSFKQLNELFAGNGMIGFVAKERVDGKLVLPEAVQIMKLKAD